MLVSSKCHLRMPVCLREFQRKITTTTKNQFDILVPGASLVAHTLFHKSGQRQYKCNSKNKRQAVVDQL